MCSTEKSDSQSAASYSFIIKSSLQWRHNGHDSVSNHQPHDCLLSRSFRRISKKTSKLRVTGLCTGNSPGTGEFPAQMASNAETFPFDDVIICWIMAALTPNTRPMTKKSMKHQATDSHNVDWSLEPHQLHNKWLLLCWIHMGAKIIK